MIQMITTAVKPRSCRELLRDYEKTKRILRNDRLPFSYREGYDVYNVSVPFHDETGTYIAARVDRRRSERSKVVIFGEEDGVFRPAFPRIVFHSFQDPFVAYVGGELVLGGVQVETDPLRPRRIVNWRTLFYRGKDVRHLKLFAMGPNRMKDIRLVGLRDGRVGVFTRPQGGTAGKGKIGYLTLGSLDELNEESILRARICGSFFLSSEWGGVNDIHLLENGLLGIVGHIAYLNGKNEKHYYSSAFAFRPETREHSPLKIIAARADFMNGPAKTGGLRDVLFPGGLIPGGERAWLYAGVSDADAQRVEIENPFLEYEA